MAQQGTEISPEQIAQAVKRVLASLNEPAGKSASTGSPSSAGQLDAKKDYPLAIKRPDLVKSATGLGLKDITLEKVVEGKLSFDDIKIHPDTLEYQAQIAISAGRPQIASNLRRAAELTKIPDARVTGQPSSNCWTSPANWSRSIRQSSVRLSFVKRWLCTKNGEESSSNSRVPGNGLYRRCGCWE